MPYLLKVSSVAVRLSSTEVDPASRPCKLDSSASGDNLVRLSRGEAGAERCCAAEMSRTGTGSVVGGLDSVGDRADFDDVAEADLTDKEAMELVDDGGVGKGLENPVSGEPATALLLFSSGVIREDRPSARERVPAQLLIDCLKYLWRSRPVLLL